ncbi:hypothetical protein MKZ38_008061 [Zalerion maritima]|uniref:Uncharacterized protein n=1 Tax=Zalerion maritima TaxID=339359 RepID=A0AAD5RH45_9PEZI|nr:hypothetical protein MKZ38_008061 [Zalerion maritima]
MCPPPHSHPNSDKEIQMPSTPSSPPPSFPGNSLLPLHSSHHHSPKPQQHQKSHHQRRSSLGMLKRAARRRLAGMSLHGADFIAFLIVLLFLYWVFHERYSNWGSDTKWADKDEFGNWIPPSAQDGLQRYGDEYAAGWHDEVRW